MQNSRFFLLTEIEPYLVLIFSIIGGGISLVSNSWFLLTIFTLILILQIITIRLTKTTTGEEILSTLKIDDYELLLNKITELENHLNRHDIYFSKIEKSINELQIPASPNKVDDLINHEPLEIMRSIAELIGNVEKRIPDFHNKENVAKYYSGKLIEILESYGLEVINQKTVFDIKLHEVIPQHWISPDTQIVDIVRPGLKKGNRVFLRARVKV